MRRSALSLLCLILVGVTAAHAQFAEGELRSWGDPHPNRSLLQRPPSRPSHSTTTFGLRPVVNAAAWHDGVLAETFDNDCFDTFNGYWIQGYIVGSYVGYQDTSTGTPKVGEIFYMHVVAQDVAACQSAYVNLQAILPANVYLATPSYPVYCWNASGQITAAGGCPTNPTMSTYGYSLNPTASPYLWPLAAGGTWVEVQFPVYARAALTANFSTYVQTADGNLNPSIQPQATLVVLPNTPYIAYPTPSATLITNTGARTNMTVFNFFTAGTVYFDIGTTTAYGSTASTTIPDTWNSGGFYQDWSGLTPGTLYHWRGRLVTASGTTYGADQTFTTTGSAVLHPRADFNGDNRSDVIWRKSTTGEDAMWLMNGVAVQSPALLPQVSDTNWKMAGVGDFDNDGKADVLWWHALTGQVVEWRMSGTSIASSAVVGTIKDTNWKIAGVGDFDGDGRSDIVWRHATTGQVAVWLMNGLAVGGTGIAGTVSDLNWNIVAVGDFDGNTKADLLWRNSANGQNVVWLMNGTALQSAAATNGVSNLNYKVVGTGDADANGRADVFWWNQSTGDVVVWLMNGATVGAGALITTVADTNWHVEAIGDFDADGKSDLIWRKVTTGDTVVWLMNGTTLKQATYATTVPDLNWSIVAPK